MQGVPEGFEVLESGRLVLARDSWKLVTEALGTDGDWPPKMQDARKRIVYRHLFDPRHARGLAAAGRAAGEGRCVIVGDFLDRVEAVEADWDDYIAYSESDGLRRENLDEWGGPVEIFDQSIPAHLVCCSPTATWGYLDTYFLDRGDMIGPAKVMEAYRASNPDVIFDPLIWMHGDGNHLLHDVQHGPPGRGLRRIFGRERTVDVFRYTEVVRKYFESFYSRADADWMGALFESTLTWEGVPQKTLEAWAPFEQRLVAALRARPGVEARLLAIWNDSVPASSPAA